MFKRVKYLYGYENIRFFPDEDRLEVAGVPYSLKRQEKAFLLKLVNRAQHVVEYGELGEAISPGLRISRHQIRVIKSNVSKKLREKHRDKELIETVEGRGYRLNVVFIEEPYGDKTPDGDQAAIVVTDEEQGDVERGLLEESERPPIPDLLAEQRSESLFARLFGSHPWHLVFSCTLYALLYVVAYIVEIAYQFDRFKSDALPVSIGIFLWIWLTSAAGLLIDSKRVVRGKANGLLTSLVFFVGAALILYIVMWLFLPGHPITEAKFQTFPARAAYLKSIYYFLPLALIFLILPFHFVASLEREMRERRHDFVLDLLASRWKVALKGAIFPRTWFLVLTLAAFAVGGFYAKAHLLDNLLPHENKDLFVEAVEWRFTLYFALGIECIAWYYLSLQAIVAHCNRK